MVQEILILRKALMYGNGTSVLAVVVASLTVGILVFFICRFILLWYFKINRRVNLLEEQIELMDKINAKLDKLMKVNESNS